MIKIWLLVMFLSMPNQPSVKYSAAVYSTEDQCMTALDGYMRTYENKPQVYKEGLLTEAFCLPFNAFPIPGFNQKGV
jgi:hypothetical protein